MAKCKICQLEVPLKRWDMGYRTCVSCSTEARWSAVPVINHKTGNEVQVVKDPEVAAEFIAKSSRVGFGTMRGMSVGYKKKHAAVDAKTELLPDKPLVDRVIARRPMPHQFEAVGFEVMNHIEAGQPRLAYEYIETALNEKRIYKIHAEQLRQIVDTFTENC